MTATHASVVPVSAAAAVVIAIHVTVVPVSAVVISRSGGAVVLAPDHNAVKKFRAAEVVAISHLLHALTALAAYGDVHVPNVQRYALVAVVQKPVATLVICVASILVQSHSGAQFFNMEVYF